MNRPYYDQVGYEPYYERENVLEAVLDDRELTEEKLEPGEKLEEEVLE